MNWKQLGLPFYADLHLKWALGKSAFAQLLSSSPLVPRLHLPLKKLYKLECGPMTRSSFSRGSKSCCLAVIPLCPWMGKSIAGHSVSPYWEAASAVCTCPASHPDVLCHSLPAWSWVILTWNWLEKLHSFLHHATSSLECDLFSSQPWFPAQLATQNKIKHSPVLLQVSFKRWVFGVLGPRQKPGLWLGSRTGFPIFAQFPARGRCYI